MLNHVKGLAFLERNWIGQGKNSNTCQFFITFSAKLNGHGPAWCISWPKVTKRACKDSLVEIVGEIRWNTFTLATLASWDSAFTWDENGWNGYWSKNCQNLQCPQWPGSYIVACAEIVKRTSRSAPWLPNCLCLCQAIRVSWTENMWSSVEWYRAWRHRGKQWKAPRVRDQVGSSGTIWTPFGLCEQIVTQFGDVWWGKWWSASQERSARVATCCNPHQNIQNSWMGPPRPSTSLNHEDLKRNERND